MKEACFGGTRLRHASLFGIILMVVATIVAMAACEDVVSPDPNDAAATSADDSTTGTTTTAGASDTTTTTSDTSTSGTTTTTTPATDTTTSGTAVSDATTPDTPAADTPTDPAPVAASISQRLIAIPAMTVVLPPSLGGQEQTSRSVVPVIGARSAGAVTTDTGTVEEGLRTGSWLALTNMANVDFIAAGNRFLERLRTLAGEQELVVGTVYSIAVSADDMDFLEATIHTAFQEATRWDAAIRFVVTDYQSDRLRVEGRLVMDSGLSMMGTPINATIQAPFSLTVAAGGGGETATLNFDAAVGFEFVGSDNVMNMQVKNRSVSNVTTGDFTVVGTSTGLPGMTPPSAQLLIHDRTGGSTKLSNIEYDADFSASPAAFTPRYARFAFADASSAGVRTVSGFTAGAEIRTDLFDQSANLVLSRLQENDTEQRSYPLHSILPLSNPEWLLRRRHTGTVTDVVPPYDTYEYWIETGGEGNDPDQRGDSDHAIDAMVLQDFKKYDTANGSWATVRRYVYQPAGSFSAHFTQPSIPAADAQLDSYLEALATNGPDINAVMAAIVADLQSVAEALPVAP